MAARIEWVKLRLNNWALWKCREASGSLGFAKQSSFLREAVQSGFREASIPVDDVDAGITDNAVESLKFTRSHLYETLQLHYPQGKGVKDIARIQMRGESTIKDQLAQADQALALWFSERSARQKDARSVVLAGGFTP